MKNNKKFNTDGPSAEDRALDRFAELMIEKINTLQSDWKKPWFTEGSMKWPKNLAGREYNGMNALMLMLQAEKQGYKIPVYCTFDRVAGLNYQKDKQGTRKPVLNENGEPLPQVSVQKGEKSFPVFITTFTVVDKETKEKIKYDDYKRLSNEEKNNYSVYPKMQVYSVFNVDQTNLKEARPELYTRLENENQLVKSFDMGEGKMFDFPAMDAMIEKNGWVCPIKPQHQDNAYYSISKDMIVIPEKSQFVDGESFYGTLFHEMTHSTGIESRLNRIKPSAFGSNEYAREELVAELGSALVSQRYGISKHVKEDSAAYLKSWLDSLKESPDFIKTTLLDVKRASSMITQRVDVINERVEQGLEPIPPKENEAQGISQVGQDSKTKSEEPTYYSSIQYLQMSDDTSRFDKLTSEQMLQEALEYDGGDSIDLEHTYHQPEHYPNDSLLTENGHYAVVYNNSVGGTYDLMRKVSEKEVRDSINRYGLPSGATEDVKTVGKTMVAEEFNKMASLRSPILEMDDGSILQIQYNQDDDSLDVGTVTNAGLAVKHSFPYDHEFSLDANIQAVNEKLEEAMSEEQGYHRGR